VVYSKGGEMVRGFQWGGEGGVVSDLTRKHHDSGGTMLKNHQLGSPPLVKGRMSGEGSDMDPAPYI
jgi:hypothetical protein